MTIRAGRYSVRTVNNLCYMIEEGDNLKLKNLLFS